MDTLRIPAEQPRCAGKTQRTSGLVPIARRGWTWFQRALLGGALAVFVGIGLLPQLGLYRTATVLSSSMRPTFSPGDMVVLRPEPASEVRVGQVISYRVPVGEHQIETHRVIRILRGGPAPTILTKGDANDAPDPWTATLHRGTAWREVAVITDLGYVVNALRDGPLRLVAVIVAPTLLALLWIVGLWRKDSDSNAQAQRADVTVAVH